MKLVAAPLAAEMAAVRLAWVVAACSSQQGATPEARGTHVLRHDSRKTQGSSEQSRHRKLLMHTSLADQTGRWLGHHDSCSKLYLQCSHYIAFRPCTQSHQARRSLR